MNCIICGKDISEKRLKQGKKTCCFKCQLKTPETKQRLSEGRKKVWSNEEHRQKMLDKMKEVWSHEDRHKRGRLSVEKRHQIALSKKGQNCFLTNELHEQFCLTKMNIRRLVKEGILTHVRKGCYALAKPVELNNIVEYMSELTEERRLASLRHTIATTDYGERLRKHWAYLAKKHMKDKSFVQKIFETRKQNGTLNTSKPEQCIKSLLENVFKEVHYQYKCDKYPFNCDFYIKDLDTFIEYNGTWTHGGRPFNINDYSCIEQLNKWQEKAESSSYYKSAIKVWTILDVKKLKIATDNQLNYLVFYNWNDFDIWYKEITKC